MSLPRTSPEPPTSLPRASPKNIFWKFFFRKSIFENDVPPRFFWNFFQEKILKNYRIFLGGWEARGRLVGGSGEGFYDLLRPPHPSSRPPHPSSDLLTLPHGLLTPSHGLLPPSHGLPRASHEPPTGLPRAFLFPFFLQNVFSATFFRRTPYGGREEAVTRGEEVVRRGKEAVRRP